MNKARIREVVPVFGIGSYEPAVAHYVDWLGFDLDAIGRPVGMAMDVHCEFAEYGRRAGFHVSHRRPNAAA